MVLTLLSPLPSIAAHRVTHVMYRSGKSSVLFLRLGRSLEFRRIALNTDSKLTQLYMISYLHTVHYYATHGADQL